MINYEISLRGSQEIECLIKHLQQALSDEEKVNQILFACLEKNKDSFYMLADENEDKIIGTVHKSIQRL